MTIHGHRRMILELCAELGVEIIPRGVGMLLRGPGVYILCTDLKTISVGDLID
ncbi:hypothetical protein [Variovorax sp.]|uniref:hypothetical protein n=1 Tax=Variovorax sp. TaxID=1871043 RepID=UPI003BAADDB2